MKNLPFDSYIADLGERLTAHAQALDCARYQARQAELHAQQQEIRWQQFFSQGLSRLAFQWIFHTPGMDADLRALCLRAILCGEDSTGVPWQVPRVWPGASMVMPILPGKIVRWPVRTPARATAVALRLATFQRSNACSLRLQLMANNGEIWHAEFDGPHAVDNGDAWFRLDRPLPAGEYECELASANAALPDNVLGLHVTLPIRHDGGAQTPSYRYCDLAPPPAPDPAPRFTLLLPAAPTDCPGWRAALDALAQQSYPHWRLLAIGAACAAWQDALADFAPNRLDTAAHWDAALAQCADGYVARFDSQVRCAPNALAEWAAVAGNADLLYGDEDILTAQGHDLPWFKPDWSPDLLASQFYIGTQCWFRARAVMAVGGWPMAAELDAEWVLALQMASAVHVARVLYHRQSLAAPMPAPWAMASIRAGLAAQRSDLADILPSSPRAWIPLYALPTPAPAVSIVIPNQDQPHLLHQCLQSLADGTAYPHWEVVIVDNNSRFAATRDVYRAWASALPGRFQVIECPQPFNFSQLVNLGARAASNNTLLLLNNDTRLIGPPEWLAHLLGYAWQPEIGCVGAQLRFADHTVQHAGLALGVGGVANSLHERLASSEVGYQHLAASVVNVSAVTGACLLVRRAWWEAVGGFDEQLAVAFNDVDFCLRLRARGLRHVVLPHARFYHYASHSRGHEDNPAKQARLQAETALFRQHWPSSADPFYNPHLNHATADFTVDRQSPYFYENTLNLLDC